jgi:osmotically-inducible protein OsmY
MGLVVLGCNSEDAGDLKRDVGKLAETGGRAIGNAQLVARVNAALAQRKGVDIGGLHVEAKAGVVTLGGHVRDAEERRRVVETVSEIRGVDKVVNNLRIQTK